MSTNTPRPLFPLMTMLLLGGCDSTYPDKLDGTYSLESARSAAWTEGATLGPPTVTGVLRLRQWSVGPEWTYGFAQMELTHSSGSPGSGTNSWNGNYGNDGTGLLKMTLEGVRFDGEFDLDGETLTTDLSGVHSGPGPSPAGRIVWKLDSDS